MRRLDSVLPFSALALAGALLAAPAATGAAAKSPAVKSGANASDAKAAAAKAPATKASDAKAPDAKAPAAKAAAPFASPYKVREATLAAGEVARAGQVAIMSADVGRRVSRMRKQAGLGHNEPESLREVALNELLDEALLTEQLRKEGKLGDDPRVLRLARLYELSHLANVYEREKILPKVTVSETELANLMPRSREERHLRLLTLPEDETEAKIRADAAAGRSFEDLIKQYSRTGTPGHGDLGFVGKSGVFFTPDVEDYLWTVPVGQLSRTVESQIGPVIVMVEETREIPQQAWDAMREDLRQAEAQKRFYVYEKGILDRHQIVPDEKAFQAEAELMMGEDRWTDRVVGRVDTLEIWFHDVDRIMEVSFQDVLLKASAPEIGSGYQSYFTGTLGQRLALGLEAREVGVRLGEKEKAALRRKMGYVLLRVAVQDAIKGVAVGEQDLKSEFEARRGRMLMPERARLGVIVTDSLEQANRAVDEYHAGAHFAVLAARYSKDLRTRQNGGEVGWVLRNNYPPSVAENIGETEPGEFFPVFKTPSGYQAVLLIEKEKQRPMTLAEATPTLRGRVLRRKRAEAVTARFGAMRAGITVDVDLAQLKAVPVESGGLPGTSPHGRH